VLPPSPRILGLNDSKVIAPPRRVEIAARIRDVALAFSVAHVPAADIDSLGMTAALRRAMGAAIAGLGLDPDHVVVDGLPMRVSPNETAVVGGDAKVAAVAAASIVAKVTRDALMVDLAAQHPVYGFEIHKGYSTAEHIDAINRHGLSPEHRRSFTPCGGTERLF
jgi:ribonuclease HII